MRAGARVDDRMPVDDLHPRVVPSPPEVVALLVVRRRAEPGRLDLAVVERLADDEALLEVGCNDQGTGHGKPADQKEDPMIAEVFAECARQHGGQQMPA